MKYISTIWLEEGHRVTKIFPEMICVVCVAMLLWTAGTGADLYFKGHFGMLKASEFVIIDAEAVLTEALHECTLLPGSLLRTYGAVSKYISYRLQQKGWLEPLLISSYLPENTHEWRDSSTCGVSFTQLPVIPGEKCSVLDIGSQSPPSFLSVDCTERHPFGCYGWRITDTTETNSTHFDMEIDRNYIANTYGFERLNDKTPEKCEEFCMRFSRTCIAAEFSSLSPVVCYIANIKDVNLTGEVRLIPASINGTVVFVKGRTHGDEVVVLSNHTLSTRTNFTEKDIPCSFSVENSTEAASSTTSSSSSTTTTPCDPCSCSTSHQYIDITERLQELKSLLEIDSKTLSSTRRTKISVSDTRVSARVLGNTGLVILISIFILVVVSDIQILFYQFKNCLRPGDGIYHYGNRKSFA